MLERSRQISRSLRALLVAAALAAALLTVLSAANTVRAQGVDAAVTADALQGLIDELKNDSARAALVAQLETLLAAKREAAGIAEGGGAGFVTLLSTQIAVLSGQFVDVGRLVDDLPAATAWISRQVRDPDSRQAWLEVLGKLLVAILAGLAASRLVARLFSGPREAILQRTPEGWGERVFVLAARVVLNLVPVAFFALVSLAIMPWLGARETTVGAAATLVQAVALERGVASFSRALLAPYREILRIVPMATRNANYTFIWIRRFTQVAVYGFFLVDAMLLLGLPAPAAAVLAKLTGLVLTLLAVVLVRQQRAPVRRMIAGDEAVEGGIGVMRARLAETWHLLAILYVVGLFAVWSLELPGGFDFVARATLATAVAIAVAQLIGRGASRLVARVLALRPETRALFPDLERRVNLYLPLVHGGIRTVVSLSLAVALLQIWGLDVFGWISSPAGARVLSSLVKIGAIGLGAVLVLEAAGALVSRLLSRGEGGAGEPSARVKTLLPLARNALRITVGAVAVLMVLDELGINIAPLLAGAGVAGLAIGFGAQKLVQDVITGLFILFEDTIAVGQVVRAGGHIGLVEGLSIRTLRLRDLEGVVHVVPFSDVSVVENLTKDFSYALMNVGVAYREDTDEVVAVLREVADELRTDPTLAPDILEPLEVLGVDAFADSAVIIKVRIKTKPLRQWSVRREFNRLMKKAFDARGIEIPFPHVTLYFGEDKAGAAPPAFVRMAEAGAPPPPRPPKPTRAAEADKAPAVPSDDGDG